MSLIYKTLFEVKLMHEYYFTDVNGVTVFSKVNQNDRLNFLRDDFKYNLGSVNDDISFEFPEALKSTYDDYRIKILQAYSGFRIVAEVSKTTLASGAEAFKPKIPFSSELNFVVRMVKKNDRIEKISNTKIGRPVSALNYFTTKEISGVKIFPFLCNQVVDYNAANSYEQGELASFGGVIKKFTNDSSADPWRVISGTGFANESDRILVPLNFYYSFINQSGLTQATFELKDNAANTIKSVSFNISESQKIKLSFSDKETKDKLNLLTGTNDGDLYSLLVTGNNGYNISHTILFCEMFENSEWGFMNVKQAGTNTDFNLFEPDGFLKRRNNPRIEAPVFEIPVTSRMPYYKYVNAEEKELEIPDPSLADYLNKVGKNLITRLPQNLTKSYFEIDNPVDNLKRYLPNPVNDDLKMDEDQKLLNEIKVPKSELFPVT